MKTGITATRLAIAAFIIPFVFAFSPSMLFIDTVWHEVLLITVTSLIGMCGIASALSGYLLINMNVLERLLAAAGGLMLIIPGLVTDVGGLGLIALSLGSQLLNKKRPKAN